MKSSILCGVALLFPFLFCPIARANDSAFSGVSGTPKPMRGEHSAIAMQSEKIVITADAKGYSTDVEFVFRNDGPKTSVPMGFPENSYNDGPDKKGESAFLRFATAVDGRKIPAKRVVMSDNEQGIEAYWVKSVDFGPKQTRRVRVSYRSRWGGDTGWGTRRALIYDFTGKNWKGLVERSDLEIRVTSPGLWVGVPMFANKPLAMALDSTPQRAVFRKSWRNWQAQGSFLFGLSRAVPFWMLDRAGTSSSMGDAALAQSASTFRIGAVPAALPQNADNPPAFTRDGVAYVELKHLQRRLDGFASDLKKQGQPQPAVDVKWDAATRRSVLRAGRQTLSFAPGVALEGTSARPILLRGQSGENTVYVPLAPVATRLGLQFSADAKHRLFSLGRGTWTGR